MRMCAYCVAVIIGLNLFFCNPTESEKDNACLTISLKFNGPEYSGNFYKGYFPLTDWVIWIEDASRAYVKTLKINSGAVIYGEHGAHTNHLPQWEQSWAGAITSADSGNVPAEFDGITAASIDFSWADDTTRTARWDFTDSAGNEVREGTYYFCAEVANIVKDSVPGAGYVPETIVAQKTCGSIYYKEGTVSAAVATENILSLTAVSGL